jgi:serine protease Do
MSTLPEQVFPEDIPDAPSDDEALDAYSRTVMHVAETVTPHLAALNMSSALRNGQVRIGSGSA